MKPPSKSSFPRASHNGYAVELSFDAGTDAAVRSIWADLAGADVCDFMATFGVHPHISLAVFDELRAEEVVPVVAAFARSQSPLPVTLSSIGVFAGDAGVVFLGAVVTRGLLAAHTDLHERLLALGYRGWPIYEVGEWVPHCTLTQEMPKDHVPRAVEIAQHARLPWRGTLERMSLVKFRPPVDLFTAELGRR